MRRLWFYVPAIALSLGVTTFGNEVPLPLALKPAGRLVAKKDFQSLGESCTAKRDWVEMDGFPDQGVQKKFNHSIRKDLSVGKKLKKQDCPEGVTMEFVNSATVTGLRDSSIGIESSVKFHSNQLTSFWLYSLQTGERYNLSDYISESGKEWISKKLCEWAKTVSQGDRLCKDYATSSGLLYSGFQYFLSAKAVTVRFVVNNADWGLIEIPEERLNSFFKLPSDIGLVRKE